MTNLFFCHKTFTHSFFLNTSLLLIRFFHEILCTILIIVSCFSAQRSTIQKHTEPRSMQKYCMTVFCVLILVSISWHQQVLLFRKRYLLSVLFYIYSIVCHSATVRKALLVTPSSWALCFTVNRLHLRSRLIYIFVRLRINSRSLNNYNITVRTRRLVTLVSTTTYNLHNAFTPDTEQYTVKCRIYGADYDTIGCAPVSSDCDI